MDALGLVHLEQDGLKSTVEELGKVELEDVIELGVLLVGQQAVLLKTAEKSGTLKKALGVVLL